MSPGWSGLAPYIVFQISTHVCFPVMTEDPPRMVITMTMNRYFLAFVTFEDPYGGKIIFL
jgi:hypothetical protein